MGKSEIAYIVLKIIEAVTTVLKEAFRKNET